MAPEVMIPLVLTTAPVAIVLITLLYRYQRTKIRYQALIQLAEKGVDL